MNCYCGSSQDYANCCYIYHSGRPAPTAEALMRSRYSAFVCGLETYLLATWDEKHRPQQLNLQQDHTVWQKLVILKCHKGKEKHNQGTVQFKAYFQQDNCDFVLQETSRFKKHQGYWFYVDGDYDVKPVP